MAVFTAGSYFDYRNVHDFNDSFDLSVSGSKGKYTVTDGFSSFTLAGTTLLRVNNDFTGVMNSISATFAGEKYFSLTGASYNMDNNIYDTGYSPAGYRTLYGFTAELAKMLEGNDSIMGSAYSDRLAGFNGNDNIAGNAGKDWLEGGAGNDTLNGGVGNDTLTGGLGADIFVFNTAPNATSNKDTIVDFDHGTDKIQLENAVMTGLATTPGGLGIDAFWSSSTAIAAHDSSDRIVYNTTTGALYYDADGKGGAAAVQIAILGNHPTNISNADFAII